MFFKGQLYYVPKLSFPLSLDRHLLLHILIGLRLKSSPSSFVLQSEKEGSIFLISYNPIYFKILNCDFVFPSDIVLFSRNIFISPVLAGVVGSSSIIIVIPVSYFSFHLVLPPSPHFLPFLVSLSFTQPNQGAFDSY